MSAVAAADSPQGRFQAENTRAAALVERITAGDRGAEAELIALFDRRLLVKLRQHHPDPELIADLRQEVWLRVLQVLRRGGVDHPRRFFGFLLGTVRNVVLEDRKASTRHATATDEFLETIPDPGDGIELLLDRDQLAGRLRECLAQMSDRDRQVLVRHYLCEEDKAVTCRLLGLSVLNYNNVLYRARQRLAALLPPGAAE